MNIKLPKKINERNAELDAYIKDRVLIVSKEDFEKTMYQLAYQMKGDDRCYFCGRVLTTKNRSIDHLYPKDYGGISITNNLVPCCKRCNNLKGNLNEKEFNEYKRIAKENYDLKLQFLTDVNEKHSEMRRRTGINLPNDWYSLRQKYEVLAPISSEDNYKSSRKYIRISELFEMYKRICRTVVISQNNIVLDGFMALMFAKNLPFKVEVPFVRLENVIVH